MDYIQNTPEDVQEILKFVGVSTVDDLFADIPEAVRLKRALALPPDLSESELYEHLRELSGRNTSLDGKPSFLGGGFYDHYIPAAIEQLILRGEYLTAYTPYQAEASQGTLQQIFEYQSMICELTGMDVSNASHYEGPTACAEAAGIALNSLDRNRITFSRAVQPPYRDVTETYFRHIGVSYDVAGTIDGATDLDDLRAKAKKSACIIVQTPNAYGCVEDLDAIARIAGEEGCVSIAVVNPVALAILKPPGECGFDIVVGDGQPLGVDITYGGPTFGFLAAREKFVRRMPGRLVGETVDADGKRAFVLTLQAREQHIRREKASSNICTNQALIALRATIYLAGLGKVGLPQLAELCLQKAHYLHEKLTAVPGVKAPFSRSFFHEFVVSLPKPAAEVNRDLLAKGIVGGAPIDSWAPEVKNPWLVCTTEKTTREHMDAFVKAVAEVLA